MSKLVEKILEVGVKSCMFIVPMRPVRTILFISFTSSSDPEFDVPAVIDESRYRLEDNYKITLKSTLPGFSKTHFYICDLERILETGRVKMYERISIERG
jgi:hypothetical protein